MKKLTYFLASAAVVAGVLTPLAAGLSPSDNPTGEAQKASKPLTLKKSVTRSDEPLEPEKVSGLSAVWKPAENGFQISFTAPTRGSYFDWDEYDYISGDLTEITRIEVAIFNGYGQDMTLLKTFENPAPGQNLSYLETGVERGGSYNFAVTVFANGEESDNAYTGNVLAGVVPALPTDIHYTSEQGAMPFVLHFTAPTLCSDNETPLDQIVKGELWTKGQGWYSDPELKYTLPAMIPGEEVEFVINDPSLTGSQEWTLTLYSQDGPSEKAEAPFYIGTDTPGAVQNLKAIENADGTITISWDAPISGSRGGWFDASQLRYDISLLTPGSYGDNREDLATNITETSYLYTPTFTDPTNLRFGIYPRTDAGFGKEAFTPYMILGPELSLPFSESFDTQVDDWNYGYDHLWATSTTCTDSYPPSWRVAGYCYLGNTKVYPPAEEGGLVYVNPYTYTQESDFMLTSPKISVEPNTGLSFSYKFYAPGIAAGTTSVAAEISFDGANFLPLHKARYNDYPQEGWTIGEAEINVPSDATSATLRIIAHNSPEAIAVIIDDIRLRAGDAIPDVYPASVSDFTAALLPDFSGVEVKLTAPTMTHPSLGDVNNEPLTMISRISLQRQIGYAGYTEIHEFTNPTPGEALTFVDTDIEQGGEYYYKALVYVGDRCDYGNYTDQPLTLGQIPAEVTELTMTSNRGQAPVTISFRLPATDWQGEPLQKLNAVNITWYNTDSFEWELVGVLTENLQPGEMASWTDTRVQPGESYEYRIQCVGTAGTSYGVSDYVYVGMDEPERPLNFVATVDEDGFVHLTWEAPKAGNNHGYIDTEHLTYTVQRGNAYSDYNAELLMSDIHETSFMDPTTFGDEEVVKYFVKATSGPFTGYSAISNLVVVGDPSELPYEEKFNTPVGNEIQPNHTSWLTSSTEPASDWSFAEMAYFVMEGQVVPVDKDGGLAYCFYGPYSTLNREDYLTSGNINVEGLTTTPGLIYNFYPVYGYNTALRVEVSFDGGEFTEVNYHDYENLELEGWQQVSLPIEVPAGAKKMQLRFTAIKGDTSCSVAIDNVSVVPDFATIGVSMTPIDGVMVASIGGELTIRGLKADEEVNIYDLKGQTIYRGKGDCTLPLPSDIYLVNLRNQTLKLKH